MTQVLDDFLLQQSVTQSRSNDSSAPARIIVASVLAMQLAGLGTTSWSPPTPSTRVEGITSSGWGSPQSGRGLGYAPSPNRSAGSASQVAARGEEESSETANTLRSLRELSGLTWEQTAKLFGVSRRAVHLWAAGKAMNAGHEELLYKVLALVRGVPGRTVADRRAALLRPRPSAPSIYDELRVERANATVLSESSFQHVVQEIRSH